MSSRAQRRAAPWLALTVALAAVLAAGCASGARSQVVATGAAPTTTGACGASSAVGGTPALARVPLQESGAVVFRVNQVGYVAGCPKLAFAMTRGAPRSRAFAVLRGGRVVWRGTATTARRWNAGYVVSQLDFGAIRADGAYALRFAGATSPPLRVGDAAALYRPLAAAALAFIQSQRDGANVIAGPMGRRPSHLGDASAAVYATPRFDSTGALAGALTPAGATVNAAGGWFDAGDYLKFVATASFTDSLLLFTARQFPSGVPDLPALLAEARHGSDWLMQMYDASTGVLAFQVGLGDGNGATILGDHDIWRLPQADDVSALSPRAPAHFAAHRPVFVANAPGQPISPNLAGGVAGALGLCAQVFAASDPAYAARCLRAGQSIYDRAGVPASGRLLTSLPASYYPVSEWRANMELAATELALATERLGPSVSGLPHPAPSYYIVAAGHLANDYMLEATTGEESLSLYDVSTLADFDLVHLLATPVATPLESPNQLQTNAATVMADRHDQLALAVHLAGQSPFAQANPATNEDTVAHAFGYAAQSTLYDVLTGKPTFEALGQAQLGWALGANAWGSSLMVGAGSVYPHCLANQVPNLSGSLTGHGAILAGATVDGPVAPSAVSGLAALAGQRACPARGSTDPFAAMDGHGFAYRDDVRSSATSEASIDVAAVALLAAAAEAARG